MQTESVPADNKWYIDSCCSHHMANNKANLVEYEIENNGLKVKVANGEKLSVKGK